MIYKANIREIFGSRSGGKGAYIYELTASGGQHSGKSKKTNEENKIVMRKIVTILSIFTLTFLPAALQAQATDSSLENAIIKTIKAYQNQDEKTLNKLIHKEFGIAFLYRRGAYDNIFVSDKISFDNPIPEYLPYDTYFETDYTIHFEELPVFSCDDWKWSKSSGIYCDTMNIDKTLSTVAKSENEYLVGDWTDIEIGKFEIIESKSRKIIVVPHGFIFYLTFIDNKWYLTIIDRFEVCSA
ncbi:MAG: hypothetical protein FWH36_04325 [Lentimicrobiaceae bacterium]|nr:hypothetical protein [Lentimicrobiaceae bacterium]